MYTVGNIASKNPIQISSAVVGIVNFLIIMGVFDMTPDQVAALNMALLGVLGLFVITNTTNTAKLNELDDGTGGEIPEGED